ncbi:MULTISPECIES: amidohydrolase family protein [unclassified Devosia]|uniref:N-acetylglucosamine-6-phosphate deacetylase n=1 Tax=unclassified Devosia TaxID=196773 RepID=UPI0015519C25|nr:MULTISPECIES: amidohydrolase family protein [unclassified Devosia]
MAITTLGLFDLQVNGYAGVDFNDPAITPDALDHALAAMRKAGVTGCLPTIITAHRDQLAERLAAIDAAARSSRLGPSMVPGYHLEGPFLRAEAGYQGCHPADAMRDPDAAMVQGLSAGLGRPILMVTLAPERQGSAEAIRALKNAGMAVSIGHSAADYAQIEMAVAAGASCSTHLGNGLPQHLPKLNNTLLAQLGAEGLWACFIADGHHIAPDALRALVRLKGVDKSILVSDAVLAAAAEPAQYEFAGMSIERDVDGVVRVPGHDNLAGSALEMDQAVRNVVRWNIASFDTAIIMAADNPRRAIAAAASHHGIALPADEIDWDGEMRVLGRS